MAKHTTLSSLFTAIADAIRSKKGSTETIVADNFPDEITALSNAEPAVIEPLEVTENGTYTAPEGVDGYSPVTVNVEPDIETETWEFTLEDDSTVTKEVQLVVDTEGDSGITPSGEYSITSNGTYDVTKYASAKVNVPIPSGYVKPSGTLDITTNGTHTVTNYASAKVNVPTTIPNGYADVSGVTATAADVLASKKIILSDGTPATGTIQTKDGYKITPGTSDQTAISLGYYAKGDITVAGDSNLKASNIKSGVSIFGVAGSYTGSSGGVSIGNPVIATRSSQYAITFNVSNASKVVAFFVMIEGDSSIPDENIYLASMFYNKNAGTIRWGGVRQYNGATSFSGDDGYPDAVTLASSSISISTSYMLLPNTVYRLYPIYSA